MIPLATLRANWHLLTIGGLVILLLAVLAWGLRVDSLRAGHKAAHAETIQGYKHAQKDAQAAFDAQIAAFQAQNRRLNDETDRKADAATIVYRDRVIRLPAAPAQCAASGTSMPEGGDAPLVDGPSGEAVILARADALICATNQARLEAAHDWAIGMH